jgi:hypothetical protein
MIKCDWCGSSIWEPSEVIVDGIAIAEVFCSNRCLHQAMEAGITIHRKYALTSDELKAMRQKEELADLSRKIRGLQDQMRNDAHDQGFPWLGE